MKWSYGAYDELVDIGPRMRERLAEYGPRRPAYAVPWALAEPPGPAVADPRIRAELFPRAKLALLYSGTMGRAHDHRAFLALARACRARSGDDVAFCFSSRGNRQDELRAAVTPADTNVGFVPFADEAALEARLGAADLHLVSLQPEWAGIVVPSKFFGSLAVGRPVLYAGPGDSGNRPLGGRIRRGPHAPRRQRSPRPSSNGCTASSMIPPRSGAGRPMPSRSTSARSRRRSSTTAGTRRSARLVARRAPRSDRAPYPIPSAPRTTAAMAGAELPFET